MDERRFITDEWQTLTPEQRVRRCHLVAEEYRQLANRAQSGLVRASYLLLAMNWLQLAENLEQELSARSNPKR